jgi:putative transposase
LPTLPASGDFEGTPVGEQVTRGDLPHWYRPGYAHFVTYRLVNSIPARVLKELHAECELRLRATYGADDPVRLRDDIHKIMFAKYDRFLDGSLAHAWLKSKEVANMIRENLYYHRGTKYELISYCIMPTHVHVVLQPFEVTDHPSLGDGKMIRFLEVPDGQSPLTQIMHSLKSFTANRANQILGRSGRFWQKESYDHWVRDIGELQRIVAYVAANPVRAGLCRAPQDWQFSSAYDRFMQDGSVSALVGWLRDDWKR